MDSLQKVPGLRFQSCPSWLIRGDMVLLLAERAFYEQSRDAQEVYQHFPSSLDHECEGGERPSTRERQVGRYDDTQKTSLED